MKIIITINTSWNIHNFRMDLVNALISDGHEVYAVAPYDEYSDQLKPFITKYLPIEISAKGTNPLKDLKVVYSYYKIFKKLKPDIVLSYTIKPNLYATFAAKLVNIPIVNNISGLGTVFLHDTISSKIAKQLYKFALSLSEKVFFQNEDDRALFVSLKLVDFKKTDVLPGSGVNLDKFKFVDFDFSVRPIRFIMLARLLYDKGVLEYAEAAKNVSEINKETEFYLYGAPDFNSKLGIDEKYLQNWKNCSYLQYKGTLDDVREIISSAHCIVLPSYREGTSKVLLEALAIGKPILTTNVPGCRDVVDNNLNGLLCEPRNTMSLVSIINKFSSLSPEKMKKMSHNSRAKAVEKYSVEIIINKYKSVIDQITTTHEN